MPKTKRGPLTKAMKQLGRIVNLSRMQTKEVRLLINRLNLLRIVVVVNNLGNTETDELVLKVFGKLNDLKDEEEEDLTD